MNLLNEITNNFQEWRYTVLNDGTVIHAKQFSGKTHEQLKQKLNQTFNSFTIGKKTIVISCFSAYTNITIFQP